MIRRPARPRSAAQAARISCQGRATIILPAAAAHDGDLPAILAVLPSATSTAAAAVDTCGARVSHVGWPQLVERMGQQAHDPIIVIDTQDVGDEVLAATLYRVDAIAAARQLTVIVGLAEHQIDIVSAGLIDCNPYLLCAPGAADWIAALSVAQHGGEATALYDRVREGEAERLARLNDEVARIANVLARLSRRNDPPRTGAVGDARPGFDSGPVSVQVRADDVRRIIRARRLRDRFFGEGVFEDPAWDMILDLYAAHLERGQVSVSSLCIASAVAPTTALRWIAKLTEAGLFERQPDPFDRRRAFMALSPRGLDCMNRYVLATRDAGLAMA